MSKDKINNHPKKARAQLKKHLERRTKKEKKGKKKSMRTKKEKKIIVLY